MTRLTTGNADLDGLLDGGIRPGSLLVLAGAPGTGKTILAQQLCFANATAERPALYYTTWSEPHDKLIRHLKPFSFFDEGMLGDVVRFVHLGDLVHGDGGLANVTAELLRESFDTRPAVMVVDSSKALHDVVSPDVLRRAIYDLASKVAHSDAALVFVGEYGEDEIRVEPEFAVADGIVLLENEADGPIDYRRLRVVKLRGGEPTPGRHTIRISSRGFEAFPRLETTLPRETPVLDGRAEFGLPRLDRATNGGLPRGSSTLLLGPTGVGKTMLALHFLQQGLEQGERCLHVSFQESQAQVLAKANAVGWDWDARLGESLAVLHVPPVEVDLDVAATLIRNEIVAGETKRVVIDSIAELDFAAGQTQRLPAYLWALAGYIRGNGGSTVFTNELDALGGSGPVGGLSFLFSSVLYLRYVEIDSGLGRGLNVLKMRESEHERALFAFEIGERGIEIGEPMTGLSGLLGWSVLRGDDV